MALDAGQKLGAYEILDAIGTGGMGEVYRARDTRLNRDVAIKIASEKFSERFEREARAIAALNHPNICTLYDVGPNFLVMELVEGESPKGPLPLEEALRIARQVASALEAAHEQGIVHRDLKPGNIKVKPDGTVKVLDFGLAKVGPRTASVETLDNSPTISMAATQAGVILGTAAYMSPEQARGKNVDRRTDLWAFGCVLYEMLTGRQAFPNGETLSDTLVGILSREPDWSALPASTPPKIRTLLERCLRKDARLRWSDAGHARIEIEEAGNEPADAARPIPKTSSRREYLLAAVAGLLLVLIGVLALRTFLSTPPIARAVQFDVLPPEGGRFNGTDGNFLSPDGSRIVSVVAIEGKTQ